MINFSHLKIVYVIPFTLAGLIFAQEEELIFTSLVVEKESPATSLAMPKSKGTAETSVQPVALSNLAKPATDASDPVVKPKKRLRDPFWPIDYIPAAWKEKVVKIDENAKASANEQWGAAAEKIKVSFTKMVDGQRVASINRKIKKPGDTIEVHHAGKTFQFELRRVYANGKLGLKKGRVY